MNGLQQTAWPPRLTRKTEHNKLPFTGSNRYKYTLVGVQLNNGSITNTISINRAVVMFFRSLCTFMSAVGVQTLQNPTSLGCCRQMGSSLAHNEISTYLCT